ncbi:MAG TPA: Ni/Fe hydrogenase subunit alpha [Geobacteraceae bacterium]
MTRTIELKPLTRVEGHGIVRVYLDGNRVENVELSLCESPRLFEALLVGKSYREVPEIICRICSICSTVHRLTSLAAIEQAFGIEVSPATLLHRELILNGGQIASHALHLFCLVLPDLFGVAGFTELAEVAPDELKLGLRIKGAGNLIQETIGGRTIHPVTLIPGRMGKYASPNALQLLHDTLAPLLPKAKEVCAIFAAVRPLSPPVAPLSPLALQGKNVPYLFGDILEMAGENSAAVADYRKLIREEYVSHSNAKTCTAAGKVVTVGAQARLSFTPGLSPAASVELAAHRERLASADIRGNNLAQAIELLHAIERSLDVIALLASTPSAPEEPRDFVPHQGTGTAAMEAPRGTLIHSYGFDSRGICTTADVITPTAINQAAMERDLLALGRGMDGADEAELMHQMEMLVRAYDPCISCAVHLVRQDERRGE